MPTVSRRIPVHQKVISADDLVDLVRTFEECRLQGGAESRWYIAYGVSLGNGIDYTHDTLDEFAECIQSAKFVADSVSLRLWRLDNGKCDLTASLATSTYVNSAQNKLSIESSDSSWMDFAWPKLADWVAAVKDQRRPLAEWQLIIVSGCFGLILFVLFMQMFPESVADGSVDGGNVGPLVDQLGPTVPGDSGSTSGRGGTKLFSPASPIFFTASMSAAWTFYLVAGMLLKNGWPVVELDVGPDHRSRPERRRRALALLATAFLIPLAWLILGLLLD